MSDRSTILDTLKDELKEKIHRGNNYNSQISEVKHGIYMFEDVMVTPAVFFWCYRDEAEGSFGNVEKRKLYIYMYGYLTPQSEGDLDSIYDLIDDLEYFLYNDFTYTDDTFLGDINVYISDKTNVFEVELQIQYDKTTNVR